MTIRLIKHSHKKQVYGLVSWPFKLHKNPAPVAHGPAYLPIAPGMPARVPASIRLIHKGTTRRAGARFLLNIMAVLAAFILISLILPAAALAWGPGVHMITGNWVLQNLAALPPDVAEALMRYPGQYLHGSLAADIFIGKGSKAREGHSHNWQSGFSLLERANNLRRRAYAFGYLSHLAADTVAHNIYVPGTFRTAPGSGRLAHVYIEMQADSSLNWDCVDARGVFNEAGSLASERILRETISQNNWKYWIKKHIYKRSITFGHSRTLRRSLAFVDRLFPGSERLEMLDYMLTLSTRGIVSVLSDLDKSPVLALDPIGADALSLAVEKQSGRRLIVGSIKNIMKKPAPPLPDIDLAIPVPRHPDIDIIVPDFMRDFPQLCTPGSFVKKDEPASQGHEIT